MVDDDWYEMLSLIRWRITKGGYARHCTSHKPPTKYELMHRIILNLGSFKNYPAIVDHINGLGHDNRRENLRICTPSQNAMNTKTNKETCSGRKGVYWDKNARKWGAAITVKYKKKYLGLFCNKNDAILARIGAEKKVHGNFARNV